MVSNGVVHWFVTVVNPAIFGYEKLCFLIVRNIDKTTKEQDLFKRISFLGDIFISVRPLEGAFNEYIMKCDRFRSFKRIIKLLSDADALSAP